MAEQINLANSDFHTLWKKFLQSVENITNASQANNSESKALYNALYAYFNRKGLDEYQKCKLINLGLSNIVEDIHEHKFWGDRLIQFREVFEGKDSETMGPAYGLCQFIPVTGLEDTYQPVFLDADKAVSGGVCSDEDSLSSYQYKVGNNGKSVLVEKAKNLLFRILPFKKKKANKLVLRFQRLIGPAWVTTETVNIDDKVTISDDTTVTSASISGANNSSNTKSDKLVFEGPVVVKWGASFKELSSTERVVILRNHAVFWDQISAEDTSSTEDTRYAIPQLDLFSRKGFCFDYVKEKVKENWFLYGKEPSKAFRFFDEVDEHAIQWDGKNYQLSFIPAIYLVKSPNRGSLSLQRLIGNTWYQDDTVSLQWKNLYCISPDDKQLGGTYRIDEGDRQLLSQPIFFKKNQKSNLVLRLGCEEIPKDKRVEIQGPARVCRSEKDIGILLSSDERIVINRSKVPLLKVVKGDSGGLGMSLTNYFMGNSNNHLRAKKREEAKAPIAHTVDLENRSCGVDMSGTEQRESGIKRGYTRETYRIPKDEHEIWLLSDLQVAVRYCLNLPNDNVPQGTNEVVQPVTQGQPSSESPTYHPFEFLELRFLLIKSHSGKWEHVNEQIKEELSDDNPDKQADLKDLYKQRMKDLTELLEIEFEGITSQVRVDKWGLEWQISPENKEKVESIRNEWINSLNKPDSGEK